MAWSMGRDAEGPHNNYRYGGMGMMNKKINKMTAKELRAAIEKEAGGKGSKHLENLKNGLRAKDKREG